MYACITPFDSSRTSQSTKLGSLCYARSFPQASYLTHGSVRVSEPLPQFTACSPSPTPCPQVRLGCHRFPVPCVAFVSQVFLISLILKTPGKPQFLFFFFFAKSPLLSSPHSHRSFFPLPRFARELLPIFLRHLILKDPLISARPRAFSNEYLYVTAPLRWLKWHIVILW